MLLQQVINFLVLGTMYSTVAVGFTLYFGTVNLVNFAHGDFCALATFLFLLVFSLIPATFAHYPLVTFAAVAVVTIVICMLIGVASERLLFRPLRNRSPLEGLIVSVAFSLLIRETILHMFPNGGNPQPFPDPFQQHSFSFGGVSVTEMQGVLLLFGISLAVAFYFVVRRTHFGRVMRALSQDAEAAVMLGVPVDKTIAGAFALGAFFAAVAGILNGAVYGSVKFDMGLSLGIKGFVGAAVGGLDSPPGALFGGLLVAFLETFVVALVPGGSHYRDMVVFVLLLAVIAVRPSGMFALKLGANE